MTHADSLYVTAIAHLIWQTTPVAAVEQAQDALTEIAKAEGPDNLLALDLLNALNVTRND
jgi:isocitrate lyase